MIERIEHIYTLYNNVFEYIPIMYKFYSEYIGREKDILLSYIVLPLTLQADTREKLLNSNKRSSLFTFCKDNKYTVGFPEMVKQYKSITNNCIQYGIDNSLFLISDSLQVFINEKQDNSKCLNLLNIETDQIKAAKKLAKILKSYDIPTIYRYLGVSEL